MEMDPSRQKKKKWKPRENEMKEAMEKINIAMENKKQ